MCNDASACQGVVVVNLLADICTDFSYSRELIFANVLQAHTESEEATGHQPTRKLILGCIVHKDMIRNFSHEFFQVLKVRGTTIFYMV
jgi:hypothetical protein